MVRQQLRHNIWLALLFFYGVSLLFVLRDSQLQIKKVISKTRLCSELYFHSEHCVCVSFFAAVLGLCSCFPLSDHLSESCINKASSLTPAPPQSSIFPPNSQKRCTPNCLLIYVSFRFDFVTNSELESYSGCCLSQTLPPSSSNSTDWSLSKQLLTHSHVCSLPSCPASHLAASSSSKTEWLIFS